MIETLPPSQKDSHLKLKELSRGVKISEADSEPVFQTPTTIEDRKEQDTKLLCYLNVEDFVLHCHCH